MYYSLSRLMTHKLWVSTWVGSGWPSRTATGFLVGKSIFWVHQLLLIRLKLLVENAWAPFKSTISRNGNLKQTFRLRKFRNLLGLAQFSRTNFLLLTKSLFNVRFSWNVCEMYVPIAPTEPEESSVNSLQQPLQCPTTIWNLLGRPTRQRDL